MFELRDVEDNILTVDISGRVETEEMAGALDAFIAKAETLEDAGLLLRYIDVEMPSMGALAAELNRVVPLLGTLDNFARIAVVANQDWLLAAARIEEAIVPGIDMRVFSAEEEDDARAYLRRDPFENMPV
ncbi:STAS/SEC14 domain-containing protein [Aestuariibius sp. 2305UL40-4]|uniref:STAS/SEC14 domain-containing protein n=1 Tax=Aestuariibius violaceus TaxID=3234132 RepID=UPI00345EEF2D